MRVAPRQVPATEEARTAALAEEAKRALAAIESESTSLESDYSDSCMQVRDAAD